MAANIPSPDSPSLAGQIDEAEQRLRNRRLLVRVRGTALNRKLRQWMTDPGVLLSAGGIGFLIGELTQRQTPKPQNPDPAPKAGYPLFEAARNLITLITLARPLFSALPGTRTQPASASDEPGPATPFSSATAVNGTRGNAECAEEHPEDAEN